MVNKIKLLKTINGIPAGTVGVCQGGGTRSTGGLTLRFDRSDVPEILTNVNADDVTCPICAGEAYVLVGCCSGRECGCMGREVGFVNCYECNLDNSKPMGADTEAIPSMKYLEDRSVDMTARKPIVDGLFECDLCDGYGNDGPDECPKCRGEGLASE